MKHIRAKVFINSKSVVEFVVGEPVRQHNQLDNGHVKSLVDKELGKVVEISTYSTSAMSLKIEFESGRRLTYHNVKFNTLSENDDL